MKNIDIIVPVYNAYEFTEECIKSILRNTDLKTHTLVLINDKSPDEKILPMLLKYKEENTDKQIVVLDNEENIKPILGQVKAGYDLWADQNIEGYIELGQVDAKRGDYFLRVVGDSMEGCHIFDGDLVFIKQCNEVMSGQIAVVMVGEEATIKKVYYKNDLMILEAANPRYESKFFTLQEVEELPVKVIGLVKFVRRDFSI